MEAVSVHPILGLTMEPGKPKEPQQNPRSHQGSSVQTADPQSSGDASSCRLKPRILGSLIMQQKPADRITHGFSKTASTRTNVWGNWSIPKSLKISFSIFYLELVPIFES